MSLELARHPRLERLLAGVLRRGTWLATGVIALGLALSLIGWPESTPAVTMTSTRIVILGVALFILLPVFRVLLMIIVFVREGDYCFGAIATLVLAIIILSAALGMHMISAIPDGAQHLQSTGKTAPPTRVTPPSETAAASRLVALALSCRHQ
jgi:uncharacterized membrane protein